MGLDRGIAEVMTERPKDLVGRLRWEHEVQERLWREASEAKNCDAETFHYGVMDGLTIAAQHIGVKIKDEPKL